VARCSYKPGGRQVVGVWWQRAGAPASKAAPAPSCRPADSKLGTNGAPGVLCCACGHVAPPPPPVSCFALRASCLLVVAPLLQRRNGPAPMFQRCNMAVPV
jgi:hypothetical protein